MNAKNIIILVAGVLVVGVVVQSRSRRAEQVSQQQQQQTEPVSTKRVFQPRLPAPRMPPKAAPLEAPAEKPPLTNAFACLLKNDGEPPRLSRDQVESCLAQNRRSAESSLAAFRLVGDRSLLQEAAEKYPNDPRVSFAGWVAARTQEDASPAERRRWLDAFKQSAPDNAPSAQAALQIGLDMGQHLDESAGGSLLTHNLTGLAIERRLLGALDPNIPYGNTGQ